MCLPPRVLQYKTELVSAFSQQAVPLFSGGQYRPIIHTVFPSLSQLPDAHTMMEANKNSGKIVLKVRDEDSSKNAHSEL